MRNFEGHINLIGDQALTNVTKRTSARDQGEDSFQKLKYKRSLNLDGSVIIMIASQKLIKITINADDAL
jgi:hypothetical protein